MKTALRFLGAMAACSSLHAAETPPAKPDVSFFTKLRIDYAKREDFNPYWKLAEERRAIEQAMETGNVDLLLELSEKWLQKCPVDADVHAMRSHAANRVGDAKAYVYHLFFAMGLMQSVMESGDGRTPETAWKVISIVEEYSILREIGAEVTGKTLTATDPPCDAMHVKLPTGEKTTLYFDVSIPMERLRKMGSEKEKKEPEAAEK